MISYPSETNPAPGVTTPVPSWLKPKEWRTPEQFLSSVKQVDNIYVLNGLKEELRKDYGSSPVIEREDYDAIWKQMHKKAKGLNAAWDRYRKCFMTNESKD